MYVYIYIHRYIVFFVSVQVCQVVAPSFIMIPAALNSTASQQDAKRLSCQGSDLPHLLVMKVVANMTTKRMIQGAFTIRRRMS